MSTATHFNPFPGLRPFEEEEEYLFFGREKQVDELLAKLQQTRFLAVVGASGSGKSSLVKSGLLPALHSGYMADAGSSWRVALFRPGNDPIGNMAQALSEHQVLYGEEGMAETYSAIIETSLRRSNLGLVEAVKDAHLPEGENVLVIADQFEELFRFNRYEQQRADGKRDSMAFVNLLLTASAQMALPIYVVFTMRSDFLGDCTAFRGLPEAINKGQYLIPRMTREERKEAIAGPIAVGGAEIAPRLLTRLLNDTGESPDMLPILQHAMMRTWAYWEEKGTPEEPIDLKHYDAIGTMSEALSQHGEEAYAELISEKKRRIAEVLFKALTDKGSDSRGIRRPTKAGEVCSLANCSLAELEEVVNAFRKPGRSFIMPPYPSKLKQETILDISHESLMRVWGRLIQWVGEEASSAENYRRLAEAAALWQEGKSGPWRNPELQIALRWRKESQPNDEWAKRYDPSFDRAMAFLNYSEEQYNFELEQKERQQREKLANARRFAIIVSIAAILAILATIYAFFQQGEAERNAKKAEAAKVVSDSLLVISESQNDRLNAQRNQLQEQFLELADKNKTIIEKQQELEKSYADLTVAKTNEEKKRREADSARNMAEAAKNRAEELRKEAERSEQRAIAAQTEANIQYRNAEDQRKRATQLKQRAEARVLANKASRLLNEEKWNEAVNLGVYAYNLNAAYMGPTQNQDVYQVLNSSLEYYYNQEFPLRHRPNQKRFHRSSIRAVAVHNASGVMASADDRGKVFVWHPNHNQVDSLSIGSDRSRSLLFSQEERALMVGTLNGKVLSFPISEQGKLLSKSPSVLMEFPKGVTPGIIYDIISFKKGARETLVALSSNGILIKNSAELIAAFIPINAPLSVAASKDGTFIAVGTKDKLLLFTPDYNATSYEDILGKAAEIPLENITAVAFSPNSKVLAFGDNIGSVWVMPLNYLQRFADQQGRSLSRVTQSNSLDAYRYTEHTSRITSLKFSPVANQLLSASMDHKAKLWEIEPSYGRVLDDRISLTGHNSWIWDADFSSDGNYVITVSQDKSIRVFPAAAEVAIRDLCKTGKPTAGVKPKGKLVLTISSQQELYNLVFSKDEMESGNAVLDSAAREIRVCN